MPPLYPVDVIFDNSALTKLEASRSNGRSWTDLLQVASLLPGVRIILPSVVADLEACGNIPSYNDDGTIHYKMFDPKTVQHHAEDPGLRFLRRASRIVTANDGTVLHEIPGDNPNIVIWDSEKQQKLYTAIMERKKALLSTGASTKETIQTVREEMLLNGGDNAILDYCQSCICTRSAIIIGDDALLRARALGGDAEYPSHTPQGYAIGSASTVGFLQALEKAAGSNINVMLKRHCEIGERNTSTEHIVKCMNHHIRKPLMRDMIDARDIHTIFPGHDKAERFGTRLDDALTAAAQLQWQKECTADIMGHFLKVNPAIVAPVPADEVGDDKARLYRLFPRYALAQDISDCVNRYIFTRIRNEGLPLGTLSPKGWGDITRVTVADRAYAIASAVRQKGITGIAGATSEKADEFSVPMQVAELYIRYVFQSMPPRFSNRLAEFAKLQLSTEDGEIITGDSLLQWAIPGRGEQGVNIISRRKAIYDMERYLEVAANKIGLRYLRIKVSSGIIKGREGPPTMNVVITYPDDTYRSDRQDAVRELWDAIRKNSEGHAKIVTAYHEKTQGFAIAGDSLLISGALERNPYKAFGERGIKPRPGRG